MPSVHPTSREGALNRALAAVRYTATAAVAFFALAPSATAQNLTREEVAHVLRRMTFGPTPAQLATITTKPLLDQYIQDQLNAPVLAYGPTAQPIMDRFPLLAVAAPGSVPPGMSWTLEEIQNKQIVLATACDYQLRELMTQFWEIHFNTNYNKIFGSSGMNSSATTYYEWKENNGFRRHALRTFWAVLRNSFRNAAMRFYLDNNVNCFNPNRGVNQNYARELLELFTMGVGTLLAPNYLNDVDIPAVTLLLSGFAVAPDGSLDNRPMCHSFTPKTIFQATDPTNYFVWTPTGAGTVAEMEAEVDAFFDYLVTKDATKTFMCTKLIQFFVGDDSPPDANLLQRCKNVWGARGNIKNILNEIFADPLFRQSPTPNRSRVSLPMTRLVSQARLFEGSFGTGTGYNGLKNRLTRIRTGLNAIGAMPFIFPSPDGFPLASQRQIGTSVSWTYGEYAHHLFSDYSALPAEQAKNLLYDPLGVVEAEITRRGLNRDNPRDVTQSAIELQFDSRYSLNDFVAAASFLITDVNGNTDTWPPSAPNQDAKRDQRVRLMVTFLNTLAQASEK